ncbi:hypothetical protein [uncultured Ruminococcus sp.]|jgi:hypothetical protein|uniref:hypothetical protein n=1 Tax=uncultured Ruminococcus sp. TaxID=165186 RepID=UPI0025F999AF|nr:hypothetical protein [uncultured Ruminococcus sp.]
MRQFSSPRAADLKFTIYDDGSGSAEYKGRKVGEIDKSTNEIRIKCDQWRTFIATDLEKEFIDKAEGKRKTETVNPEVVQRKNCVLPWEAGSAWKTRVIKSL